MSSFNLEDISYLYEHIATQDQSSLDETSDYYDEELANLVEDIFSTIAYNMIASGHTAEGVVGFLTNSSETDILEYYMNPPVISEGTVSEEHIETELARLDEGLGGIVSGLKLLGKGAMKAVAPAARTAKVALKRAAGPGVRKALGGAVGKVKDIAAKVAPKLPGIAKGALALGAGVGAGYLGAKLTGGGAGKSKDQPGTSGPQTVAAAGGKGGKVTVGKEYDAVLGGKKGKVTYSQSGEKFFKQTEKGTPASPSTPSGSGSGAGTPPSKPPKSQKPTKPVSQLSPGGRKGNEELEGKTFPTRKTAGGTEYEVRTPTRAEMEASKAAGGGEAGVKAAAERGSKLMGGPEGPGQIDTKSVEADIKAAQERDKRKAEQKASESSTKKESYDAFDVVLDYLFETNQVDTLAEASYVMMEMDSDVIQSIVLEQAGYLADEYNFIVEGLIAEGYDLSEYTEDEFIDILIAENILPALGKLIVGINKARGAVSAAAKSPATKQLGKTLKKAASDFGKGFKGTGKGGALVKSPGGAMTKAGKPGALVKSPSGALTSGAKPGKMVDASIKPVNVSVVGGGAKGAGGRAAAAAAPAGGGGGGAAAGGSAGGGRGGAIVPSPGGKMTTTGGKSGALVAGTTATGVAKAAKGAAAALGKGGGGGRKALLAAGLLGAGALGAGMLAAGVAGKKEAPRRKEALVGSQNAKKPLTATPENMKTAANVNKQGGIALGKGGLGYLAKKGDKMVIKQAKAVGADDGIIGKAARALGLTKAKDKAIEAQRQAAGRKNREAYLSGQELTDKNITGYQVKGAKRKGEVTGTKIKMDNK
jgi:hypothetical protein